MAFNSQIHCRQSIRLPGHDYSGSGAYFITLCAYQRAHLFWQIIDCRMALNDAGIIVQNCWHAIPKHFPTVVLDAFVVMPNHMHGIIIISNARANHDLPINVGAIHESPLQSPLPTTIIARRNMIIPKLIGRFKMNSAKQINIWRNSPGIPLWQRNYWERIIRDDREMQSVREYIHNNPAQWQHDNLNES